MATVQSVIYGNPDYYPPMLNGAEALDQAGIEQEILCSTFYSDHFPVETTTYPRSTSVIRLGGNTSQSWRSYVQFLRAVWNHSNPHTDCIVGYDLYGFFAARLLAWKHRRPLVYHIHDYNQWGQNLSLGQKIAKIFELMFARSANLVVVPDAGRARVVTQELRLRQPALVVANAALTAPDPNRTELRDALGARGKAFSKIVWRQGMIGDGHGITQTIKSIPLWKDPTWGFVIMGPGNNDYKSSLLQLAEQLGVRDRFEILPAVGLHKDVKHFTVGADIGHCIYEDNGINNRFMTTASNKTMEYMAAGKPIILTNTPENKAIIDRFHNGVLVDCSDPSSIADGINRILADPDAYRVMSEGSKRAFHEEFNYVHQYAPLIEKFHDYATRSKNYEN